MAGHESDHFMRLPCTSLRNTLTALSQRQWIAQCPVVYRVLQDHQWWGVTGATIVSRSHRFSTESAASALKSGDSRGINIFAGVELGHVLRGET
jgi:hypothetical protein